MAALNETPQSPHFALALSAPVCCLVCGRAQIQKEPQASTCRASDLLDEGHDLVSAGLYLAEVLQQGKCIFGACLRLLVIALRLP
jgi:hypothetical protein